LEARAGSGKLPGAKHSNPPSTTSCGAKPDVMLRPPAGLMKEWHEPDAAGQP